MRNVSRGVQLDTKTRRPVTEFLYLQQTGKEESGKIRAPRLQNLFFTPRISFDFDSTRRQINLSPRLQNELALVPHAGLRFSRRVQVEGHEGTEKHGDVFSFAKRFRP